MLQRRLLLAGVLASMLAGLLPAEASALRAGVGKADITPQTGYYLGGWTRADRTAQGQHTRLHSRALVLQSRTRKVALVQVDLFMIPSGMVKHIGDELAGLGYSEQNILISASHTHSGPGGYANFNTFNTAAPSFETTGRPGSFLELFNPRPADRQLYTFLVGQIASAIRRADRDRASAVAGWGETRLLGVTRNRSIEAHLANHGIRRERGEGSVGLDPGGYEHTIDPAVNVLRVDKLVRRRVRCHRRARRRRCTKRRRLPIGAWSNFADHGTVTKSSFEYYNQDHHGSAMGVFEQRVRRAGRVPRRQAVLNVYGNSDEGDQSAGLDRHGPAASDYVGQREAAAMLQAWKRARPGLRRHPPLDLRWTRACFCGRTVEGRRVASEPAVGLPFFTGSEEERGPLYDVNGENYEGRRAPASVGPHGNKLGVNGVPGDIPRAVPLMAVRVGDRMIASIPGEGTKEVGDRVRAAVGSSVAGSGVSRVVIAGLVNEYMSYFTTPEEYDRQHYEGGQTYWGRQSSVLIKSELASLAGRLVRGQAAQPAFEIDVTNGVRPDGPGFGAGAASGAIVRQPPRRQRRLEHVHLAWRGGPDGLDRPVGAAFLSVQRRKFVKRRRGRSRGRARTRRRAVWRTVASDLGLQMLWTIRSDRIYRAYWDVPLSARRSRYRFVIRGKRYRLVSRSFRLARSLTLGVRPYPVRAGRVGVTLRYPSARRDRDLNYRPPYARGGKVRFRVGGRRVTVRRRRSPVFSVRVPAGASVLIPAGGARDRYGNVNRSAVRLR